MGDGDGGYGGVDYRLGDLIEDNFWMLRAMILRRNETDDPSVGFTTMWTCIMIEFLQLRRSEFR